MKKVSALCFALAVFFYASAADCRICFLGDTACQAGQFQVAEGVLCVEQNRNWVYEYERCERLVYGSPVCNDSTGNYYNRGTCPVGYKDMYALGDRYVCDGSTFGEGCGVQCCSEEDVRCNSSYMTCKNNSTGQGSLCTDKDGTKYEKCECSSNTYFTQCKGDGVQPNYSNYCINSSGETWYSSCSCKTGWKQTALANIKCSTDGDCCACTVGRYTKLPGTESYCWEGATCSDYESCKKKIEQCAIVYQSDFDNFWGGYDVNDACNNLTVDCATLGYDTGTAGTGITCADGTEPYRCPFDHTQVYCESGISAACDFVTKTDCEVFYSGSNCTKDSAGCYKPTSCKTGYGKTTTACANEVAGNWSVVSVDSYGCGLCQCESTCVNKISIIPGNATAIKESCSACGQTTQIMTGFSCNSGYVKSDDGMSCVLNCSADYNLDDCPWYADCSMCGDKYRINAYKTPSIELFYYETGGGFECYPANWGEDSIEIVVQNPNGQEATVTCVEGVGGSGSTTEGLSKSDRWVLKTITTSQGTCTVDTVINAGDYAVSIPLSGGYNACIAVPVEELLYYFEVY